MDFDVAVVGAGPAGSTCALTLEKSGLKVALLDKSVFPRDKICGDAIPALCGRVLESINHNHLNALEQFAPAVTNSSCKVVAPDGSSFTYAFQNPGWCCPRWDFDDFLLGRISRNDSIQIMTGQRVEEIQKNNGGWHLQTESNELKAKVLVGADGANGVVAGRLTNQKMDPDHHCAAVRQYFREVQGLQDGQMEIHLVKGYLPGYFWIFPLGGGRCNVGFGMLSHYISHRKVSLRKAMHDLIQSSTTLRARFQYSKEEGACKGFGLPLGSRKITMSGDGFLLCGDAACLVEPATGEGIGNAMYSGWSAGQTILQAFGNNRFDAAMMKEHDERVYGKLWKGMRQKYLAQRWMSEKEWVLNGAIRLANLPGPVNWMVKRIF
jgi:geranylgeranyl reductase family protein